MAVTSKTKLNELRTIISRMSLEVCSVAALPELGLRWRDVAKTVRNNRLPMTPASIARVVHGYAKSLPDDQLEDIVRKLRLALTATQPRLWHVVNLSEPLDDSHVVVTSTSHILSRLFKTLRGSKAAKGMRPEVETIKLGDLVFISVQLVSEFREKAPLYIVMPPGRLVALVSSLGGNKLLQTCIEGLGFQSYTDAKLSGQDIHSLLRINDQTWNENPDNLGFIPEYNPMPVVTPTCLDYTYTKYNADYVDSLLGPNPPILTDLNIQSRKKFYDPRKLNKVMNIKMKIKTEDVAKSLKDWVKSGVLEPTSDLFHVFLKTKSNRLAFEEESE